MSAQDWQAAVAEFRDRVEREFSGRFAGMYLYGSRARGDAGPDSDADIAVVLRGIDFWPDLYRLADITVPAMARHGVVIHARPVDAREWDSPAAEGSFLWAVQKDAVNVDHQSAGRA